MPDFSALSGGKHNNCPTACVINRQAVLVMVTSLTFFLERERQRERERESVCVRERVCVCEREREREREE